ncbi:hypothetical protein OSB04_017862 [Centaurea solstitialis]|uniref:F-box domain-containing protein n=1 Tax=Centaurea solstitialis TaxID=347529 RepID=A0AA38WB14_9ASTR|nr:hypothetical protein OSB04_017862 [Centaurea solstitialis]
MASPPEQPTTIQNLPGELLSEIMIRVPAKPLARMRSVSKSWNHLLSQPSFIKSHLHRSLHNNNDEILLVLADRGFDDPFADRGFHDTFSVTAHFSGSPHLELTDFVKPPVVMSRFESETFEFLGSVNGLICFCYRLDYVYSAFHLESYNGLVIQIWNPSLSTILALPPCQLPYPNVNFTYACFRFGYDPKTDDYKLFKLMRGVKESLHVEVYSLRKDSWGLITQRFSWHVTQFSNEDKVCVDGCDGCLHWLGYIGEGSMLQTIVAFDLGMETFSEISLPKFERFWHNLGVIAGKLCLLSRTKNLECEVWVMNEYGVAKSWVKRNVISELRGVFYPYGFTPSNKFLFATLDDSFGLYDPISANTKIMASIKRSIKVVRYVESLVWMAPVRI